MANNLVPNGAWNLILIESGRPILLRYLGGYCLAVGIDDIRTTVLVRHITEAHLLSIFREDIYLIAPVRSVAIEFVLVEGMLRVGMTKAFLTEELVASMFIDITKEASEFPDPSIMTIKVKEINLFLIFSIGNVEWKTGAARVVIKANDVYTDL